MECAWRRDRHLRHGSRMSFEKLEMLQHRVTGEAELAVDLDALGLGLHAMELNGVGGVERDAVETAEEVEVPPRTAQFAVGGEFQPDLFLLLDDLLDLAVFDRPQRVGGDLAALALGARLLDQRRSQQAADMVGAEWRRGTLTHCFTPQLF